MDDQLKQLMDYTKFHVGLYVSLIAGLVVFVSKDFASIVEKRFHYWLLVTMVLFLVAGMAGGLIGSSIPEHNRYDDFIKSELGPWEWKFIPARTCIHLEHTAFWLGAVLAVVGLFVSTNVCF